MVAARSGDYGVVSWLEEQSDVAMPIAVGCLTRHGRYCVQSVKKVQMDHLAASFGSGQVIIATEGKPTPLHHV